jgi:hypothetical protein
VFATARGTPPRLLGVVPIPLDTTDPESFDAKSKGLITVVLSPGWVQTDMGGPEASLSPEESVRGMILAIERLKLKANGGFFDYRGQRHHLPCLVFSANCLSVSAPVRSGR